MERTHTTITVTDEMRAHVMRPPNILDIKAYDGIDELPLSISEPPSAPTSRVKLQLKVEQFGEMLRKALEDMVTGYGLQLRQGGNPIVMHLCHWSQTPADLSREWALDTQMHIASVSKMLTGIGMVKLLDDMGLSYDAKIIDYLPTYWQKGPNIDAITFRHLMNHTSGFQTGTSSSDFMLMKSKVAQGVQTIGSAHYENMNFGLCRILMAVLTGEIDKNVVVPGVTDHVWDYVTIEAYRQYMQDNVFTPAGVSGASFDHAEKAALAYRFPSNGETGWNSGHLASMSGGAGWHLSIDDVLNVMHTFRRMGTIMPVVKAQALLDNKFGIDQAISTAAGPLYYKNGSWSSNGQTEQCVAYYLPDDMELVVFVNSPIGPSSASLGVMVTSSYINSLA